MNFELDEAQLIIKELVHDFALNEIAPGIEERERTGEFPEDVIRKAAELGFCGITVPEDYDGAGFDSISSYLIIMELARVCPSTAITLSVHNSVFCYPLRLFGSEDQKQRFLRPAARGDILGAFALTEPDAGSDAANLQVTAVEDGDDFIIEGTKAWVTNGGISGAYLVMAVTGSGDKRKEISSFIVPADTPGLTIGKNEDKMGLRASVTTQLLFEDCRISKDLMLGKRGEGLKVALTALDGSRIGVAAQAVGIARGAFDEALRYSQERKTFGKPLCKHQAISIMLADMATEIEAAECLAFRAAWLMDVGEPFTKESSFAKYYATEMAQRVAGKALQIHGAYGYSKEYPIERMFRDARVLTIYEGTSEVQKIVIARNLLK